MCTAARPRARSGAAPPPPAATGALVDPAHACRLPACCRARGQRRLVGRWVAFDEVSMAAQLQFRDVTLGYDRHPAVHHLTGGVVSGPLLAIVGPTGAGKSTLFGGIAGILKPLAGSIVTGDLDIRDIA